MISIFRRHQRWLLLVVAIMTIIAFAWLYNTTDTEQLGANRVAQMYGKTVFDAEVDQAVRLRQLAMVLGMENFLAELSANARSQEAALDEFVWNLLTLRHEAKALWIEPTSDQILDAIRALPVFQTPEGRFDSGIYTRFLAEQLPPRGLTERHIEDVIRDSLLLNKARALVSSPVVVSGAEIADLERLFQKVDLAVVSVPTDTAPAPAEVTDEEVQTFFDENKAGLVTPVFRSVTLASLGLNPEQESLTGRERVEAMQVLAAKISEFHDKLVAAPRDMESLAKASGIEIVTTDSFDTAGRKPGASPAEPGEPAQVPGVAVPETFKLSAENPVSEILQEDNRFYVLRLEQEAPSRPLTYEEAAPKIREMLVARNAVAAQQQHSEDVRKKIEEALAAGGNFEEVLSQSGVNAEILYGAEPWAQTMDEKTFHARNSVEQKPGVPGPLARGQEGFQFVIVMERHPADATLLQQQGEEFRKVVLENKRTLLFLEWLRTAREKANLRFYQQR